MLCNAVRCQKVLVEKSSHSYLHYSVSSIHLCVCTLCILPLLWRVINISVKCHFTSRPVYSLCLHQGFEMSCPRCFRPCRSMCIHAQQWTCMYRPGGNLWFRKMKPMWECFKAAFFLLTCRGRLHWLQKEVCLYESQ